MITRTTLIESIIDTPGTHWVLEAGAGFGKTILIEQVRSASVDPLLVVRGPIGGTDIAAFLVGARDAAHRIGRTALAETLGAAETPYSAVVPLLEHRCSLAVDDLHRWDAGVAEFVVRMAEEAGEVGDQNQDQDQDASFTVFLLSRLLSPELRRRVSGPNWSFIGAEALAFAVADVSELLAGIGVADRELSPLLFERTGGWPIAVASAAARMARGDDPHELLRQLGQHNTIVGGLLHSSLEGVAPADLAAASTLAMLPFFDDRIATMVGSPGLLDRLAEAGLPITRQTDGWSVIAEVFGDPLANTSPPEFHPDVVEYLVDRSELHAAITVCISMGQNEHAARIIAGLDYEQEARLDPSLLNAAMTTIGRSANIYPRSLLVQAQISATFGLFDEALPLIERAASVLADTDPELQDPVHLEVLLELGLWRLYEGQVDEATLLRDRCESAVNEQGGTSDEHDANRARLLDLQGMLSQVDGSELGLHAARAYLGDALAIWRRLQAPRAAAVTVFRLSSSILFRLGQRQEALDLLDSLPSVGRMTLVNKARLGLERAVALPYVGRAGEVPDVLAETRRIAQLLGLDWIIAWSIWAEIVAASFTGDGHRVEELVTEYVDKDYDLMNPLAQAGMWVESATALARCGRHDLASSCLDRGRDVPGLPPQFVDYADVYLAAQSGPPEAALSQVREFEAAGTAEVEKRWTLPLLAGLCHLRAGDANAAIDALKHAQQAAADLGQATLPNCAEGAIVRRIRSTQTQVPPASPAEPADPASVQMSVFGTFRVTMNGEALAVPGGMVSTFLKVLAVRGGHVLVDQLIDPMWPDADLELGRRRLRNVVRRAREACGDIVVRSGDSIQLADHVQVDFARAVAAAEAELRGRTTPDALAAAIELNRGDLLPGDRYEDWAEDARADHGRRLVQLYDRQAELAERAGDVDLAVRSLEAAQHYAPFDDSRMRHACALLRADERSAAAAALAERHSLV